MFQQKNFKTHFFLFITLWLLCALMMQPVVAFAAEGKLVYDTIHSPALEGNLVGDSADRSVIVYLPPSYDTSPEKRYPVVYILHGAMCGHYLWVGGGICAGLYGDFNIKTVMDRLITNNNVREMIIVVPDADTKYLGAMYTNTPVLGNYEDYITLDLVEHVDNQYRTLPQSASRGIAGHSLGGYGAIYLAMKYPEVYAAVYGHEPSALVLELWVDSYITPSVLNIIQSKDMNQFRGADYSVQRGFFMAASFSPNPDNPPFFVDWPWELVDGQIKRIEPIWNKWLEYELLTMVTSLRQKLLELKAIRFDAGTGAQGPSARIFDQTLTAAGIPHIYEEFAGGHSDRTAERVETKVLPFFSDVLAFEMLPVKPAVQPKGKLATTWGEMKRRR